MSSSSFLVDTESDTVFVADASVIINLNATGRALDIITAHQGSVVVTDRAFAELVGGARNGHRDDKKLQALIESGAVRLVELGKVGNEVYSSLVDGTALQTLDDGEAATIGYAYETGAVAIIDEKKARRICTEQFPALSVISTADMLMHRAIAGALGIQGHFDAVVNALREARMRVPSHLIESVVSMIGDENAAMCPSLPRGVRPAKNF